MSSGNTLRSNSLVFCRYLFMKIFTSRFCSVWMIMALLVFVQLLNAQDVKKPADSAKTIPDTLLLKLQKAQSAITAVNAANKKGYNIEGLKNSLLRIQRNIKPLQDDFKASKYKIESKSLQSYALILKDASDQLSVLRNTLIKHNSQLQQMSQELIDLSSDSLLMVSVKDDAEKKLYKGQIKGIRLRLQDAGELNRANLDQVSRLLADVSALDIIINDLQTQTNELSQRSGKRALSKEAPYLWNAPLSDASGQGLRQLIGSSFRGQQQILSYFIGATWDKRVLSILFATAFFIWVHANFKLSVRTRFKRKIGELKFDYLKPFPVLATAIVLFNITPLFEPDAPSLYIEIIQLLLLLAITIHLRTVLPVKQLRYWLLIIWLCASMIAVNMIVKEGFLLRSFLVILNIIFIYLGVRMYKKVYITQFSRKYVKGVIMVFMLFNALGLLLNIFGRVSLSKVISITGVIGLTQMIGLAVFTQILLDALDLQIRISSCNKGLFSRVSHSKTRLAARKVISILCIVLWVMVFLINLNFTAGTFSFLEAVLTKTRSFGSIHFTLGDLLFFVIIVYFSNQLQKHVPILFGEGDLTYGGNVEQKSSKVALIRLVIIIVGVLLAVSASGLPVDKLTVILGALSVGIGLGMQNIVNNFVSGIILIFEKPFRIGDYVELADKKGKVKDIGIRSSKLLTAQGSEVIIPNGDLLSGRLVNWTINHDYVKTEVTFKVSTDTDLEALNKLIGEEVKRTAHVMSSLPAEVLVSAIAAGAVEIKVMAWVKSIYAKPGFKSELMRRLIKRLNELEIKIV